ncbi:hypothetical protein HanPI659440_Chr08g0310471 [Helianthus annuus]|nr:hypothetical protein HanPI659440_Chr08g0310471 [Helianthus annuus]
MCYMIKAWWIRRWYFLYISAFIVLYIVALYESLGQDMKHFYTRTRHCFTKYTFYPNSFSLGYSFNHALSFHHHLIFIDFSHGFTKVLMHDDACASLRRTRALVT